VPHANIAPAAEGDVAAAISERASMAPQDLRQLSGGGLTPAAALALQQAAGNRAVRALVARQALGQARSRLLQRDDKQPDTASSSTRRI
jgi:hypothetical protein